MSELHENIKFLSRDAQRVLDAERRQRRAEIAVLQARLDRAGIPALPPDEERAIRLPIIQDAELDPASLPEPKRLPTRKRQQKGRL